TGYDTVTQQDGIPGSGHSEAREHLDGCGLGGAVHSEQREQLALSYSKVKIIDRGPFPVPFCQAGYPDFGQLSSSLHSFALKISLANCLNSPPYTLPIPCSSSPSINRRSPGLTSKIFRASRGITI